MREVYLAAAAGVLVCVSAAARAEYLPIAGGPTYGMSYVNPGSVGHFSADGNYWLGDVSNSGVAVRWQTKFASPEDYYFDGVYPVRIDALGSSVELPTLGGKRGGAVSINDSGIAVGAAIKQIGYDTYGIRAARWDANGQIIELENLGTDADGLTLSFAHDINNSGISVGGARKYVDGVLLGERAVRWDENGVVTELPTLGTHTDGTTQSQAIKILENGTIVGQSRNHMEGMNGNSVAVRWDSAGAIHELELPDGFVFAGVADANESGMVVGALQAGGQGSRPVLWNAAGEALVMETLGSGARGTTGIALAVNESGYSVGVMEKFEEGSNRPRGHRAVRWDPNGVITELPNYGLDADGASESEAVAINDAGIAVGYSNVYDYAAGRVGWLATVWLPDNTMIDLNTMVDPDSGWQLGTIHAISEDGWMTGEGFNSYQYEGRTKWYGRLWVAQLRLGGQWLNTTGETNTWGKGRNWSTGTPAGYFGPATFRSNETYTVRFDANETGDSVTVEHGIVTFDLSGFQLHLDNTVHIESPAGLVVNGGSIVTTGLTNDGRLSGDGTIVGNVFNRGIISPGNSPGVLTIDGDLAGGGAYLFEVRSLAEFDQLIVTGTVTFDDALIRVLWLGDLPESPETYSLLQSSAPLGGSWEFEFTGMDFPAGWEWDTRLFAVNGSITLVPEPSALAWVGCLALSASRYAPWRRRRSGVDR